tara:strand:- start:424 stop:576 length:153 start_codon:yes stop_codon:yes gene_type:complete
MIRIIKDGKVVYETDNLYKVGDEILFHDYDVKEIVVNINYEWVEEKYGRL